MQPQPPPPMPRRSKSNLRCLAVALHYASPAKLSHFPWRAIVRSPPVLSEQSTQGRGDPGRPHHRRRTSLPLPCLSLEQRPAPLRRCIVVCVVETLHAKVMSLLPPLLFLLLSPRKGKMYGHAIREKARKQCSEREASTSCPASVQMEENKLAHKHHRRDILCNQHQQLHPKPLGYNLTTSNN